MKCEMCGKNVNRTVCNKSKGNPKFYRMCKDCCVKEGGHKCAWWEVCWNRK
ncbi:MAG: hypothetical protein ABIF08_02970 [Nanoarchaeota archaeon]